MTYDAHSERTARKALPSAAGGHPGRGKVGWGCLGRDTRSIRGIARVLRCNYNHTCGFLFFHSFTRGLKHEIRARSLALVAVAACLGPRSPSFVWKDVRKVVRLPGLISTLLRFYCYRLGWFSSDYFRDFSVCVCGCAVMLSLKDGDGADGNRKHRKLGGLCLPRAHRGRLMSTGSVWESRRTELASLGLRKPWRSSPSRGRLPSVLTALAAQTSPWQLRTRLSPVPVLLFRLSHVCCLPVYGLARGIPLIDIYS